MIEVDRGQHAHRRGADGGGVVAAAQPHLEHGHVHRLAREVVEGQRRRRLEHAGVQPRDERPERLHPVGERVLGDGRAVHADPLAEGDEVRRGVETDATALGPEDRGQHGGNGALAVGAADLRDGVRALGPAERVQQRLDSLEPGTHPGVLAAAEGEEPGQRLGVGHAGGVGWSAKKASRRRSVSLSSRRSTMRSS